MLQEHISNQKTFQCEQLKWNKQRRQSWLCLCCQLFFFSLFFCFFVGSWNSVSTRPPKNPCKSSGNQPTVQAAGSALDRWASAPKVPGESSASFAVEKSRPSVSFAKEPLGEAEVVGYPVELGTLLEQIIERMKRSDVFLFKFMIFCYEHSWQEVWWTSLGRFWWWTSL